MQISIVNLQLQLYYTISKYSTEAFFKITILPIIALECIIILAALLFHHSIVIDLLLQNAEYYTTIKVLFLPPDNKIILLIKVYIIINFNI